VFNKVRLKLGFLTLKPFLKVTYGDTEIRRYGDSHNDCTGESRIGIENRELGILRTEIRRYGDTHIDCTGSCVRDHRCDLRLSELSEPQLATESTQRRWLVDVRCRYSLNNQLQLLIFS
jgi:hypothetical protein